MRKIYTILVASILLLGISSAAATIVPQSTTRSAPSFIAKNVKTRQLNDNTTTGNLTGVYAIKNETGYEIEGEINGVWEKSWP